MHSFKKRYKVKKNMPSIIVLSLLVYVMFLTAGFSSLADNLKITAFATVRPERDIRVTNINMSSATSEAYTNWTDYNVASISTSLTLPNRDSTVTYDVKVTNIGNVEMGILSITGLPSNLTYSISNYNLKDPLCDDSDSTQCKLGAITTLHITIGYKSDGYNSSNITYSANMNFDFKQVYSIAYVGFSDISALSKTILDGETKSITFNGTTEVPIDVSVNNATGTYSSPTLTLSGATGDVTVTRYYSVTYVDFPGDTTGLASKILPSGGTIAFNSVSGIPEMLTVTGAYDSYDTSTHVLTLSNVVSNVVITMLQDGNVEIVSVTRTDILNVTENNPPQITNDGQGVTFDLSVVVDSSNSGQDFYVKYAIVIHNDSVHEQKVLAANFVPRIVGSGNLPHIEYSIKDSNGDPVLNATIAAKTSQTYYLTIDITPQEEGNWGVEGESGVNIVENGTLIGSISGSAQGDVTSNQLAHFTASITNSYDVSKTFTFAIDDSKFSVVNSSGNAISSMTIAANTTDTYDFYIKNLNGNNFMSSPYDLGINITSNDEEYAVGVVSLLVDVDPTLTDHTAPVISNVSATTTSTEKEILVSWRGTDDNTITNYYVETYTSDASGNGTKYHTETLSGGPNGTQMTYTATVPYDDAYYYFKVYAKDQSDNIATAAEIAVCDTNSGHCSASANKKFKWNFVVTLILTNAASSNGTTTTSGSTNTVTFNVFYDNNVNTTLSGSGNNYDPPSSISSATITYPGASSSETLQSGSSTQTAYSYNTSSHVLNVYHVTGDIEIRASGEQGTCFAEGTKILMADGSYKNVENIGYDDLLAVWNYDTGTLTSEYPLWIENEHITDEIIRVTFSDNSYIDFVGNHAIYSTDKNMFVNIQEDDDFKIGTHVAKLKNNNLVNTTVVNIEKIKKHAKYYFVGTTTYYNVFANNVLTTDNNLMISNLYGFEDSVKWPKTKALALADDSNILEYNYFEDVLPYYLYKGFRVREAGYLVNNNVIDLDSFKKYITSLIVNPRMIKDPIKVNNDRYWMVTTSEDSVNDLNKKDFLRKEGSSYILPKSDKRSFKGWYNTSNNLIYYPGEEITVDHGIHFKAIYSNYQSSFLRDIYLDIKKIFK